MIDDKFRDVDENAKYFKPFYRGWTGVLAGQEFFGIRDVESWYLFVPDNLSRSIFIPRDNPDLTKRAVRKRVLVLRDYYQNMLEKLNDRS